MSGTSLSLKERIIQESQRIGIDKTGFASAEPFSDLEKKLEEQQAFCLR